MQDNKNKAKVNPKIEEKKKKRILIIFCSILGAGVIAGASVGIYFAVKKPKGDIYHTIKFVSDGNCFLHEVTKPFANVEGEVKFKEGETANYIIISKKDYFLPTNEQITFKTPDGEAIAKDTYSYNPKNGKFSIRMLQDVVVTASVNKASSTDCHVMYPEGEGYEGLTITPNVVHPGEDLKAIIGVNGSLTNRILPKTLKSVKVGGAPLTTYTYELDHDYSSADFVVSSSMLTSTTITIELDLEYWYKNSDYLSSLTPASVTKEHYDNTIGEIQTLNANGIYHKVRLIGVDEDSDKDGNTIHTTWEFSNLLSDSSDVLVTYWDSENNFNYLNSMVRKALTNEGSGETSWDECALDMIKDGNSEFIDAITAPAKQVLTHNGKNYVPTDIKTGDEFDKLFLLSCEEYGKDQESAYTYYKEEDEDVLNGRRAKGVNYWTRSPCTRSPKVNTNNGVWMIYDTGDLSEVDYQVCNDLAIAPAFCI